MYKGIRRIQKKYASVGDIIVISVKDVIPKGKVKKGAVHKAVVVEQRKKFIETMDQKYNLIPMLLY